MAQHLADIRAWFERTEKSFKKSAFYNSYPLNEFWQKHNVPVMLDILNHSKNDEEALARIQDTFFFIVSLDNHSAQATVDWLRAKDKALLDVIDRVGESPLVPDKFMLQSGGGRYSNDQFRIGRIATNIFQHFSLDANAPLTFFELGAGLGHLSRFIQRMAPQSKYIISDLPISLCFSYLFLRHNFPEKRVLLLEAGDGLSQAQLDAHDIVFAPPSIVRAPFSAHVDVMLNTCSLGEMDNSVSRQWYDFAETRMKPKHFYSLNRFLNRVNSSPDYDWRKNENGQSTYASAQWDVTSFNIDNEQFFGPYIGHIHPRYLELALTQSTASAPVDMKDLASRFLAYDFVSLYENHNWAVNYHGAPLAHDLSQRGALFEFWNAARVQPSALTHLMLLGWLDWMNFGNVMLFEETLHQEAKLGSFAQAHKPLAEYLEARRSRRAENGQNVITRHDPLQLAELVRHFAENGEEEAVKPGLWKKVAGMFATA